MSIKLLAAAGASTIEPIILKSLATSIIASVGRLPSLLLQEPVCGTRHRMERTTPRQDQLLANRLSTGGRNGPGSPRQEHRQAEVEVRTVREAGR